ncbi:MAG: hypothetical protein OEM51_07450 [Gammaproteobacteria bacterium]|nr:hypothetical protein [Gammaproteobacteria bacterium]
MIDNYGTQFAVDWDIVARLNRSYHTSQCQWDLAETRDMSQSNWYNPFSWDLPTTRTVDVDWSSVRETAQRHADADMNDYRAEAKHDMQYVARDLEYKLERTAENRRKFTNLLREVQRENHAEIENAVDEYDGMINVARFVRDSSADIVAVGSTIATGGAAAGLLGASSALKGVYKYQDTGKAGAALLHGGGSLVLGMFKVGGNKLTSGAEYTLIMAKGMLEAGTSLAAGDSLGKAVEQGGLKIASDGAAQILFSSALVKQVFQRMPVPFNVWSVVQRSGQEFHAVDVANELVAGGVKKVAARTAKGQAKSMLRGGDNHPIARTNVAGFANDVPVEKKLLLYFGVVNMSKGIGHGW